MNRHISVSVSGWMDRYTGIGVLQRALYPLLADAVELRQSPRRERKGPLGRVVGLVVGALSFIPRVDASLCLVSPFPLVVTAPTVAVIHDVRWTRNANILKRIYRHWDLRRLLRRSAVVACISHRTRDDVAAMYPEYAHKLRVRWLGPGIVRSPSFSGAELGTVMIVGAAPHKRNELAAQLIAATPNRFKHAIGVNVSATTRNILEAAMIATEWHDSADHAVMTSLYARAEYFIHLGTDEGFGLPYIEALCSDCVVIAIRQPLTEELLDRAAILLDDGSLCFLKRELTSATLPDSARRKEWATQFSWERLADSLIADLLEAVDASTNPGTVVT